MKVNHGRQPSIAGREHGIQNFFRDFHEICSGRQFSLDAVKNKWLREDHFVGKDADCQRVALSRLDIDYDEIGNYRPMEPKINLED